MALVGLAARKLSLKKRNAKLAAAFPNGVRCQKCLEMGHWSYECKQKRKFVHRSSRTKQLNKRMEEKAAEVNAVGASTAELVNGQERNARSHKHCKTKSSKRSNSSSGSSTDSSDSESSDSSSDSNQDDSSDDSSTSSSDSDSESSNSDSDSSGSDSSSDSSSENDEDAEASATAPKKQRRNNSSADSSSGAEGSSDAEQRII